MRVSTYRVKAAVLVSPRKIEIHEYDVPEVKPRDLLLKVEMAGICGTDIHLIYSEEPFPGEPKKHIYPMILGHETVGIIVEIGSEARSFDSTELPLKIGDRVALIAGQDPAATHPLLSGWGRGWATHMYVYGETAIIYKLPKEVPPEVGVLVEPLSIGVKAIERALEPSGAESLRGMGPGRSVVVQGSGPIGLMITILSKLCGAQKTIVVGAPQMRLDMCKEFGADGVINIEEIKDPVERVVRVKELIPEGSDVVFEAAGVPAAFAEGLEMVKPGGAYVEVGHFTNRGTIPINPYILCRKDINIYGSWGGGPHGFMMSRRIIEAYHGKLHLERIVTHKFPIERAIEAIETMRKGNCMKVAFAPT